MGTGMGVHGGKVPRLNDLRSSKNRFLVVLGVFFEVRWDGISTPERILRRQCRE